MVGMGLGAATAEMITSIGAMLITGLVSGFMTGLVMQQLLRQGEARGVPVG
jgi:hypothetical protein